MYLTFIGGGVFGNAFDWIAEAIGRAICRVGEQGARLKVVVCYHREVVNAQKNHIKKEMRSFFG